MVYILVTVTDKGYIEEQPLEGYKSSREYYNHISKLSLKTAENFNKVLLKNKKLQKTLFGKLN